MIPEFLRRLAAPAPRPADHPDARLALAALLVQVARADGDYSETETSGIDRILAARHGLSAFEAGELRRQGEALEAGAGDSVRFTRAIKEAVPPETRAGILEALWEVALSDGSRAPDEAMVLRLVAGLLGVSDLESGLARKRVEARLDAGMA